MTDKPAIRRGRRLSVGLAGFGEVGQACARALIEQGAQVELLHPSPSERSLAAARDLGVRLHREAAAAFSRVDLVISAVPGSASMATARGAAEVLPKGILFADMSSAPPSSLRESAALFAPGDHVDVAIMGAVSIHGHRTPLLASGPGAGRLRALLQPYGFEIACMPDSASGDATALKLLRSVFTKGMDAVVMECLLAAEAAGLRGPLLGQMADLDRSTTRELIEMFVRTHVPAADRRRHETEAVADQLRDLGIEPIMTRAVLERYERTLRILGAQARNPAVAPGATVFDAVLPWMLAAERAAPPA